MTNLERLAIWPIGLVVLAIGFALYSLWTAARFIAALADRLTGSQEPPRQNGD